MFHVEQPREEDFASVWCGVDPPGVSRETKAGYRAFEVCCPIDVVPRGTAELALVSSDVGRPYVSRGTKCGAVEICYPIVRRSTWNSSAKIFPLVGGLSLVPVFHVEQSHIARPSRRVRWRRSFHVEHSEESFCARLVDYSKPHAFHVEQKTRYSLFESAVRATVVPRGTAVERWFSGVFGGPRVSRETKGVLQHPRGLFPTRMSFHVEQRSLRWFRRIGRPCVSRETKGASERFPGLLSDRVSFHVEHLGSPTCQKEKSPL
jgi:hypothetical protein